MNWNITKKTIAINKISSIYSSWRKSKYKNFVWECFWAFDTLRYILLEVFVCTGVGVAFFLLFHRNGSRIIKHKLRPSEDITHKCTEIVYNFGKMLSMKYVIIGPTMMVSAEQKRTGIGFKRKCTKRNKNWIHGKYYLNVNSCFTWNIERRKCKRTNVKMWNASFITQHQNVSSCTNYMSWQYNWNALHSNTLFMYCIFVKNFDENCKLLPVLIK